MEGNEYQICTYNGHYKKYIYIFNIYMHFSDKQMSYFCIYALYTAFLNTTQISQTTLKHGLHAYIQF